jgi:hypothetical protein
MLEELSSHFRKSSKPAVAQRGVNGRFNGWLAGVSLILYDKPAWDNISGWVFGGLYSIFWQVVLHVTSKPPLYLQPRISELTLPVFVNQTQIPCGMLNIDIMVDSLDRAIRQGMYA